MTDREKAIVMAHTGICMLAGEKFRVFHAYIEDIMGRPVYTHELAIQSISDEIKEKSRDDFIKLCKEEQEPCADTVNRQAVRDTIFVEGSCEKLDIDFAKILLLQRAIKALPSVAPLPKTGQWIPVSERLPEKGEYGKVLVTDIPSGGTLWITVIIAHYSDLMGIAKPSFYIGEVGKKSFQNITEQVIAWMPLPQPYEPQERSVKE